VLAQEVNRQKALRLALEWEDASRSIETVEQARRVLSDITERVTGESMPAITIDAFFMNWIESRKGELSPSSWVKYEATVREFLNYMGGKTGRGIDTLTKADLVTFRDSVAERTRPKTANDKIRILKAGLQRAFKDGFSKENVGARVDFLKTDKTVRRSFTEDELRAVLKVAEGEWRGLILFGLYSGQRLGDIASLTWANIGTDGTLSFQQGKTSKEMVLPMAKPLRDFVRDELPAGDEPASPLFPRAHHVVTTHKGIGALSHQFRELLASVGLAKSVSRAKERDGRSGKRETSELSFHSLRHNTVSMLKVAGVSETVAMAIAGHSSKEVSRLYTHIQAEDLAKALDRLPAL
jgi:integrase